MSVLEEVHAVTDKFLCTIMTSVSGTDQNCSRGKGAHRRRDGQNAEKAIVFHNFLKASQGLLASIVDLGKALDTVDNNILKKKLISYEIADRAWHCYELI